MQSHTSSGVGKRLKARIERIADHRVVTTRCAPARGFALAERWIALLGDGSTRFVKVADDAASRADIRAEAAVLSQADGDMFPRFTGFDDHPIKPLLVLEDLTGSYWPPAWRPGDVATVEGALGRLHGMPTLEGLPHAASLGLDGWPAVITDSAPFLALGLASAAWLDRNLDSLAGAAANAPLDGGSSVHLDVGGGNVCFVGPRVVFVDWARAVVGNPDLDLAFWLPSMHAEGGVRPDEEFTGDPGLAALVSGFYAARAGRPPHRWGAGPIRATQRRRLASALPWACRALGLEPPDGSIAEASNLRS